MVERRVTEVRYTVVTWQEEKGRFLEILKWQRKAGQELGGDTP